MGLLFAALHVGHAPQMVASWRVVTDLSNRPKLLPSQGLVWRMHSGSRMWLVWWRVHLQQGRRYLQVSPENMPLLSTGTILSHTHEHDQRVLHRPHGQLSSLRSRKQL